MAKTISAEEYKLRSSFEEIRKTLLTEQYQDRLDKPLAYWALPNDRRLPLAFLGRTIGDLLASPFDQLTATPGIGQKKIDSLVVLLRRAASEDSPSSTVESNGSSHPRIAEIEGNGQFSPTQVSELHWTAWRETVRRHRLGEQRLGRLVRTLQNVPTVIWNTKLDFYLDRTIGEIRKLKTHGEKRVSVVLETFHYLHELLGKIDPDSELTVRLTPRFIAPIEDWIVSVTNRDEPPASEEIVANLCRPILSQIANDAGETVADLATGRLGINGDPQTVRMQSRRIGVTRARVYQLLDDCSKLFEVRWPTGRYWLDRLARSCENQADPGAFELVVAVRDLLYPVRYEQFTEA